MQGPFDDQTVTRVADTLGVRESVLAEAAESVQAAVSEYPGVSVDGLVYEWRQAFADDPLVERTPTAWVLRVPERVWRDVTERAGVRDDVEPALRALHGTETPDNIEETEPDDTERVALVLSRVE
ncbi:hypothetical protein [Halobacterium jilantaiense]|uniref:DUF8048 domain-containing protein n=1 Tax=Halobacterium jilantaiense TaxID=355548 RepID=A0A1I0MSW1_9EURY|nr:hypothetical protein [Halobacterium jilantaiense]SEV91509.1 hypothetical protein SAMN04487945_0329 [Halobacterium jilantaiense]